LAEKRVVITCSASGCAPTKDFPGCASCGHAPLAGRVDVQPGRLAVATRTRPITSFQTIAYGFCHLAGTVVVTIFGHPPLTHFASASSDPPGPVAEAVRLWRVARAAWARLGAQPAVAAYSTRNQRRNACRDRLSRATQPVPYSQFCSTRAGTSTAVRSLIGFRCANRFGKTVAASSDWTNQRRL